jgi:hypothetical protein
MNKLSLHITSLWQNVRSQEDAICTAGYECALLTGTLLTHRRDKRVDVPLLKKDKPMEARLRVWMMIGVCYMSLMLWGCGGDGQDDQEHASSAGSLVVVGTVLAPQGQIARRHDLLQRVVDLLAPAAHANIAGLAPVADGTPVALVSISDAGVIITTHATTTTAKGMYTFNLTVLGLTFASDILVQVGNPATGAQVRAFVTTPAVHITPDSEAVVRLVLEQIAATQGASLRGFTVKELADLAASVDLLTTARRLVVRNTLDATVAAVKDLVATDAGLMTFIAAATTLGQTVVGPGDVSRFFPFAAENTWAFQGTVAQNGQLITSFTNTLKVGGTTAIDGVPVTVLTETNPRNNGTPVESFSATDDRGITNFGNNDPNDLITKALAPFQDIVFPLTLGFSFEQVNRINVDLGGDVDGDGINDRAHVVSRFIVLAFEDVVVPAGTFPNSVKLEGRATLKITLSHSKALVMITGVQTQWFAPGIGPVKRQDVVQTQLAGQPISFEQTFMEELVGFIVDGQRGGLVP